MNIPEPWNSNNNSIYFCDCLLDCETQTLVTKTSRIRLRSKLWQVFITFATNPERLVLRDDLINNIWHGNTYTGQQGLTHAICHIRRIIKQAGIKANIITLPKKGYILKRTGKTNKRENIEVLSAAKTFDIFDSSNKDNRHDDMQFNYHIS